MFNWFRPTDGQWLQDNREYWSFSVQAQANALLNPSVKQGFHVPSSLNARLKAEAEKEAEKLEFDTWKVSNEEVWSSWVAGYTSILMNYSDAVILAGLRREKMQQIKDAYPSTFSKEYLVEQLNHEAQMRCSELKVDRHMQLLAKNGTFWKFSPQKVEKRMPLHMIVSHSDAVEGETNQELLDYIQKCNRFGIPANMDYSGSLPLARDEIVNVPYYQRTSDRTLVRKASPPPAYITGLHSVSLVIERSGFANLRQHISKEMKLIAKIQNKFDEIFKEGELNWGIQIVPVDLFKYKIVIPEGLLKTKYTIFTMLKALKIKEGVFKKELDFTTIEDFHALESLGKVFEEKSFFQETLKEIGKFFPGTHEFKGGEKPLTDFYQKSKVAKENYEEELGISWDMARAIEKEEGLIFFPHSLQILTDSDDLMLFLEKCYVMLDLRGDNKLPKTFIADTRDAGMQHKSNVNISQMQALLTIFNKIKYVLKGMEERDQINIFNKGNTAAIRVSNAFAKIAILYGKKMKFEFDRTFAGYLNPKLRKMLTYLDRMESIQDADAVKFEMYRMLLNENMQLAPKAWHDLKEVDIDQVRTVMGTKECAELEKKKDKKALEKRVNIICAQFEQTDLVKNLPSYPQMKAALLSNVKGSLFDGIFSGFSRDQEAVDFFEQFVYTLKTTTLSEAMKERLRTFFISQIVDDEGNEVNYWVGCGEGMSTKMQHLVLMTSPSTGIAGSIQQVKLELVERYLKLRNQETMLTKAEYEYANVKESAQFRGGILAQVSKAVGLGLGSASGSELAHRTDIRFPQFIAEAVAFVRCNMRPFESIFLPQVASAWQMISETEKSGQSPEEVLSLLEVDQVDSYCDDDKWNYEKIKQELPQHVFNLLTRKGYLVAKKEGEADQKLYLEFLETLKEKDPAGFERETGLRPMELFAFKTSDELPLNCPAEKFANPRVEQIALQKELANMNSIDPMEWIIKENHRVPSYSAWQSQVGTIPLEFAELLKDAVTNPRTRQAYLNYLKQWGGQI